jgi:hypothetical protein
LPQYGDSDPQELIPFSVLTRAGLEIPLRAGCPVGVGVLLKRREGSSRS